MAIMMLAVRPTSVAIGLAGSGVLPARRRLIGWFGIRGVGSLSLVVTSVVVHGVSVTPMMTTYRKRRERRAA